MSTTDELLTANQDYASAFALGGLAKEPGRHLAVLACMDARLDVYRLLGLQPGDAHVIRNAGGIVTDDAIRSLMISARSLGTTEVVIVQHTSCGMSGLDDESYASEVEAETGVRPSFPLGGFSDVEASVRSSIETLRGNALVPQAVRGFVYDVATGALTEVTA